MDKDNLLIRAKLVVLFEDPFWIGLLEREYEGHFCVTKVTFGAEPKDYEVEDFLLQNYNQLTFSPTVESGKTAKEHVNPKRLQRDAKKQMQCTGIGTKSQQALKLLQEQKVTERKQRSRKLRDEEQHRQFELKQLKKKQKHKGR